MNIRAWMWSDEYLATHPWIFSVLVVFFITFFVFLLVHIILRKLLVRLKKSTKLWDDALVTALAAPLKVLIWIIGISIIFLIIREQVWEEPTLNFIEPVRDTIYLLLVVWFAFGFIRQLEKKFCIYRPGQKRVDRTIIKAIGLGLRLAVLIAAGLVFMQMRGIPISGVVAFGGLGGLIISFAAKDSLTNLFGGLMIFFDRSFDIGDWISSPEKEIEGEVEHIGWRLTTIIAPDKKPIYVPNSLFSTIVIKNASRKTSSEDKQS